MLVSIHQSHYMPWLGYLDKIDRADVFILLDDVQFEKNDWQNRNRILTPGAWQWITVPVSFTFGHRLMDVACAEQDRWPRKHWQALKSAYGRCPFFKEYSEPFEAMYHRSYERLVEANAACLNAILDGFGIRTRIVKSSDFGLASHSTERLIGLCQAVKGDQYLYGGHGKDYMDMAAFERSGIQSIDQAFAHPRYPQRVGNKDVAFTPGMAAVDLLFNAGPQALSILRSGRSGRDSVSPPTDVVGLPGPD